MKGADANGDPGAPSACSTDAGFGAVVAMRLMLARIPCANDATDRRAGLRPTWLAELEHEFAEVLAGLHAGMGGSGLRQGTDAVDDGRP